MQNDRVKAARGERGAVVLAHCAVAVVTLVAVPGQCGATAEHCAGVMDEVRGDSICRVQRPLSCILTCFCTEHPPPHDFRSKRSCAYAAARRGTHHKWPAGSRKVVGSKLQASRLACRAHEWQVLHRGASGRHGA